MKIIGIGNAIVDVICKVDENFLAKNKLIKSTMKLVDESEFKKLLLNLEIEDTVSGGSVANSIVGLSQLGNNVGLDPLEFEKKFLSQIPMGRVADPEEMAKTIIFMVSQASTFMTGRSIVVDGGWNKELA